MPPLPALEDEQWLEGGREEEGRGGGAWAGPALGAGPRRCCLISNFFVPLISSFPVLSDQ